MGISSESAKAIARLGVDMIITADAEFSSESVKAIVSLVKAKGKHITVHAGSLSSESLKAIALLGAGHVTIAI